MPSTFDTLDTALREAGALTGAAEAHGHLCGLVCLLGEAAIATWLEQAAAGQGERPATAGEARIALETLAWETVTALEAGDMSFLPALPADNSPLEDRADDLGHWCQGFMHGLGVNAAGRGSETAFFDSAIAREIVVDFTEISRAAFSDDETKHEGETAYTELTEYVRVSAQLVFDELRVMRDRSPETAVH